MPSVRDNQRPGKAGRKKAALPLPFGTGFVFMADIGKGRGNTMQKPEPVVEANARQHADTTAGDQPAPAGRTRKPVFSLPSGDRPLDGFTIKRGIGVGGFGEVYFAHTDGGKEVALKRIQRNLDIELRGVRQCLNLKHPNLLDLYDIKHDDKDQSWVVMEYVSGDTLQRVIEQHPNGMPLDLVAKWFDGITAGVAHLHKSGIVHRDLKPGNIFIDVNTVKVGDYGLSKFISCSRRSGQTQSVGTLHYMAPEIGQGRYGKEIDVYALGVMLYEMITGRVPFDGESSQEIIMKHLTAQPDLRRVPQPYRTVVARALAKDPEKRLHDVNEMRAVLQQHQAGQASHEDYVDQVAPAAMLAGVSPAAAKPGPQGDQPWDEPIARAVQAAWREISAGFRSSNMGSTLRFALTAGAVLLLVINARWIIPYLGILALSYGIYLAVRAILFQKEKQQTAPRPRRQPTPVVKRVRHRKLTRRTLERLMQEQMRKSLAEKSKRQRLTESLGSLLMAALVAGIVALLGAVLINSRGQAGFYQWAPNTMWLALSSTLAAWGVLLLTKRWEARSGDVVLRRFSMFVLGIVVGLASFGIASYLNVQPITLLEDIQAVDSRDLPAALHYDNGLPTILGYIVYFAALFSICRWWKVADPTRKARFSIMATALALFTGIIVQAFCPLPQGFLVAMITAAAVQLSSPWLTNDEREKARVLALAQNAEKEPGHA